MTKSGRQAAREALAAAQEEAARLARANEEDLAGFFSAHGRLSEVDDWLAERMAALTAQAEERRAVLRLQCGRALRAVRDRGQNMAGLAVMARMTPKTVRELIKAAENESAALDVGDDPEPGQEHQVTETSADRNGSEEPGVRPGDPENTTPLAQTDSAEARADRNGEAAVTTDQLKAGIRALSS